MLDYLSDRYGRRGTWLIVLGAVWFVFGAGVLLNPTPVRPWVLTDYLPSVLDASGWWISGAAAAWLGLRGPGRDDSLGHAALCAMPLLRVLSFAASWVLWVLSSAGESAGLWRGHIGWAPGWYSALVWVLVSLMLRLIADWPNPLRPIPHPPVGATGGE
jgi:hypothetical protein